MITVDSYEELSAYVKAAAKQKIGLLLVTGIGGTGKTYTIKKQLEKTNHLRLNSRLSGAMCYTQLYHHRGQTIFLNDIDKIFTDPLMISLLKQAGETNVNKLLQWNTKSRLMEDVPLEFTTTSNLIIDANELPKKNKNLAALLTRGVHINFAPKTQTVFSQMKRFAKDKEILVFLSRMLHTIEHLDLRKYVVAEQLKKAGLDWKHWLTNELSLSQSLETINSIGFQKPYKERVQEWKEKTGKSGRSYDRALLRWKKCQEKRNPNK